MGVPFLLIAIIMIGVWEVITGLEFDIPPKNKD
jgi:hypothetical protein